MKIIPLNRRRNTVVMFKARMFAALVVVLAVTGEAAPWLRSLSNSSLPGFPVTLNSKRGALFLTQDEQYRLYAFDLFDGSPLWSAALPCPLYPYAASDTAGDDLFVQCPTALFDINVYNGHAKWQLNGFDTNSYLPLYFEASLLVDYPGPFRKTLTGINAETGSVSWTFKQYRLCSSGEDGTRMPVIVGKKLFLICAHDPVRNEQFMVIFDPVEEVILHEFHFSPRSVVTSKNVPLVYFQRAFNKDSATADISELCCFVISNVDSKFLPVGSGTFVCVDTDALDTKPHIYFDLGSAGSTTPITWMTQDSVHGQHVVVSDSNFTFSLDVTQVNPMTWRGETPRLVQAVAGDSIFIAQLGAHGPIVLTAVDYYGNVLQTYTAIQEESLTACLRPAFFNVMYMAAGRSLYRVNASDSNTTRGGFSKFSEQTAVTGLSCLDNQLAGQAGNAIFGVPVNFPL